MLSSLPCNPRAPVQPDAALGPTCLDLFSGCGGFSLGAHQAGLRTAVAVDLDPILSGSFEKNFPGSKLHLADVSALTKRTLTKLLPNGVDAVIGGAPCQAFSEIGAKAPDDPRRALVAEFFRVVALVKPKFFIFENVRGLAFPGNVGLLNAAIKSLPASWTVLEPTLLDAANFGAPTRRKRIFVFGFNREAVSVPKLEDLIAPVGHTVDVRAAISDLAGSIASKDTYDDGFARWSYGSSEASSYARQMRAESGTFTGHMATKHTATTIARFETVAQGAVDEIGRYPRLKWEGLCPTLRAGTGSDRGSFQAVRPLHPEEHRVLTPRECARLQGFPDWFDFHPTVWHSCRMIGNSVSPVIAEVLVSRIMSQIGLSAAERIAAQ